MKNGFAAFKAFTLAEVIIVVGIIGIIAQVTIPTLLSNIQNEELHSQFKKTYSELNQIAMQFKNDNDITVPEYTSGNWTKFTKKDFWKYLKDGNNIFEHSYEAGFTSLYRLRGLKGETASNVCDVSSYYTEISGKIYTFNDYNQSGENGPVLCVDINGEKKPNTYGKDFFLFIFTLDGTVIPMGQYNSRNTEHQIPDGNFFKYGAENCDNKNLYNKQYACAYYALLNQHPTEAGKDYWHDFLSGN